MSIRAQGAPPESPPHDTLSRAIVGMAIALALLTIVGLLVFGGMGFRATEPLAELTWLQTAVQAFTMLSVLILALLCFARYRALGAAWAFWTGIAYLASGILDVFYLLTWPGLLGQASIIARLSNTAAWIGNLTFSCIALFAVTVNLRWPPAMKPSRALLSYAAAAACAVLIGLLSVSLKTRCPRSSSGLPSPR